jgi:hypothetical protein
MGGDGPVHGVAMTTPLQGGLFGRDTSAMTRVRYGRLVSGTQLVGEHLFRTFTSPQGCLLDDDPTWGFSLADKLGSNYTQSDIDALPGMIEAAALQDERIDSVDVTAVGSAIGTVARKVTVTIIAELVDGGTFTLVLSIQDLTVALLDLTAGVGVTTS